jgi:hypothetical protein
LASSGAFRKLESEDRRAVLAATADTPIALEAWSALLAETDFADISRSTQRLAPMVYLNLKDAPDVAERGRLRGAYKYAWSKNHNLIAFLVPIVSDLGSAGINYRIAKGIAIQLALGIVGARVVGDVDLVISRDDVEVAKKILEKNGFRCNSVSACGLHPPSAIHNALDFNNGDAHIDVHVAELKDPSRLLIEMLREPPRRVDYAGSTVLIPSPELLLLHSATHGKASASETDFSQSVTDIALLLPACDLPLLRRQAESSGIYEALWSLGQTLNHLGRPELNVPSARLRSLSAAKPAFAHKGSTLLGKARYAASLWRQRFHGGKPILAAMREFTGQRFPYVLWTLLGQFSSLERFAFARRLGFLRLPTQPFQGTAFVQPFNKSHLDGVTANSVASKCFDYRFAFRCPDDTREFVLTFDGECFDDVDVAVHHNGVSLLRIVAGSSERRLAVLNPPEHNEISLRPISVACEACFDTMKSLEVSIAYRREPRPVSDTE